MNDLQGSVAVSVNDNPVYADFRQLFAAQMGAHALDKVRRKLRAHWPRGRSGKLAHGQNGVCGQRRLHRQGVRDGPRRPLPLLIQNFVQKAQTARRPGGVQV